MTTAERVESQLAQRLANALRPESPNAMSAVEVREWVLGYLQRHDKELAKFPEEVGEPHWNLLMRDAELEDALFATVVFRSTGVEFFCGTTDQAFDIRQFAEHDFPDDVEELSAEMRKRFRVPDESLHLSREEAEAWLGRGGWCG